MTVKDYMTFTLEELRTLSALYKKRAYEYEKHDASSQVGRLVEKRNKIEAAIRRKERAERRDARKSRR